MAQIETVATVRLVNHPEKGSISPGGLIFGPTGKPNGRSRPKEVPMAQIETVAAVRLVNRPLARGKGGGRFMREAAAPAFENFSYFLKGGGMHRTNETRFFVRCAESSVDLPNGARMKDIRHREVNDRPQKGKEVPMAQIETVATVRLVNHPEKGNIRPGGLIFGPTGKPNGRSRPKEVPTAQIETVAAVRLVNKNSKEVMSNE